METLILDMIDTWGEPHLLFALALGLGVIFGAGAQRSRFCMRASAVELADGHIGPRLMIWLLVFTVAILGTQGAVALGFVDLGSARQLSATGSLSGAIIGGVLFGIGMILARGCASRLLVLAATGNLRAIVTGLVLTLTAQAALRGVLAPLREDLSNMWLIAGGPMRSVTGLLGIPAAVLAIGAAIVAVAIVLHARKQGQRINVLIAATLVGLAVAGGWVGTALIAQASFEIIPITSMTFTGPSSDTLMALVNDRALPMTFAAGLVPGVALGAFAMAVVTREFRIERFGADTPMERYLIGAVLMGFGSMLAGGCAVGAALSGGAAMATTAFVAGTSMWAGAMITHALMARLGVFTPLRG